MGNPNKYIDDRFQNYSDKKGSSYFNFNNAGVYGNKSMIMDMLPEALSNSLRSFAFKNSPDSFRNPDAYTMPPNYGLPRNKKTNWPERLLRDDRFPEDINDYYVSKNLPVPRNIPKYFMDNDENKRTYIAALEAKRAPSLLDHIYGLFE